MPSSLLLTLPEGPWASPPGRGRWGAPAWVSPCLPLGDLPLSLGTEDQRKRTPFPEHLGGAGTCAGRVGGGSPSLGVRGTMPAWSYGSDDGMPGLGVADSS